MKKFCAVYLLLILSFFSVSCSYTSGDPQKSISDIEIEYSACVKAGEPSLFRFIAVKESGKKDELSPDDVECYFADGDINDIYVESGNLFTFKKAKKYEINVRSKNELSIKGKVKINVYEQTDSLTASTAKLQEIPDAKEEKSEITVQPKEAPLPLEAVPTYDYLVLNGALEFSADFSLDCKKYYEKGAQTAALDLTYFPLIKIQKDGKTAKDSTIKIFSVNDDKCENIFNNINMLSGVDTKDYLSFLGKKEGEKFTDSVLMSEFEHRYAQDPSCYTFSSEKKFAIMFYEEGRYEVIVDAKLKDGNKKFYTRSYLVDVAKPR